jgi:hypothetical protein
LQAVQDEPTTPGTLAWENDSVVVWTENQGAWVLTAQRDGTCVLDDEDIAFFQRGPLPQAVHDVLFGETQTAAWADTHIGPLRRLAPRVRGGDVGASVDLGVEVGVSWGLFLGGWGAGW